MDSFEFNKMAGAVLAGLLFVMGVGVFSDAVFAVHHPEKPGYALPSGEAGGAPAAEKKPAAVPLADLLAKADVKKGEAATAQCKACHDFTKGGPNKVGPNLWGVVDRPIASHAPFDYSAALKDLAKKDGKWTFEHLHSFINNPRGFAGTTKMAFGGEKNDQKLADILAYLRTLSDNPVPLPTAAAAAAPAEKPAAPAEKPAAPAEKK